MKTPPLLLLICLSLILIIFNVAEIGATVKFTDVTLSSGINFRHRHSATSQKYLIETMAGGVAFFDYDNDGWLDIFFANGARLKDPHPAGEMPDKSDPQFWNRLYRNNREGTFTDVTEKAGLTGKRYSMGVAAADFDNDGDTDLCVTDYGGIILYRNEGNGSFADVTSQANLQTKGWTTSAGFFDYNNDGYLDLFICRYMQWDFVSGGIFCGDARPQGRSYCHPDKFPQISNYLFKNNGNGKFTDVSAESGLAKSVGKALGVAFADYNHDNFVDIFVANDSAPQFLLKNNGDATFTETAAMAGVGYTEDGQTFAGMGTDFADIDEDGHPDIIATALPYEYYSFFRNNGKGSFSYLSLSSGLGEITRRFSGWGVRIFDYDNDGAKDVFVANGHVLDNIELTQPHLSAPQQPLLLKFSDHKFIDVSRTAGTVFERNWNGRGAAFGDLDNDGDIDIAVSNRGGVPYIIRNDGGNANRWLGLELRGVASNRDGIGAKIVLTRRDNSQQHGYATTAGSYLSSHDRRVLFGLGKESAIKKITVHWPDGQSQEILNPTINGYLKIRQTTKAD